MPAGWRRIVEAQRNIAHKLIEEFMLLANETVATYVEGRGMPSLYRIHEQPDVLKVEEFEEFISGFGYSLAAPPGAVRPRNFQRCSRSCTASRRSGRSRF